MTTYLARILCLNRRLLPPFYNPLAIKRYKSKIGKDADKYVISGPPLEPVVDAAIHDFIFENLAKHEDRPAFTCGLSQRSYTAKEIYNMSRGFGAALLHHGLKKGDVVGVLLPNLPEFPVAILGVWFAGGVVSPISTSYTPDEAIRQCNIAETKIIVTMPFFLEMIQNIMPLVPSMKSIVNIDAFGEPEEKTHNFFEMVKHSTTGVEFSNASKVNTTKDLAILPFSSGTTGPPKAVMLTHSNLCSNANQYLQPGLGFKEGKIEKLIGLLPFYHCYGCSALILIPLRNGDHVCTLPKFDPLSFVAAIKNFKPTTLHVVTPLVNFMVQSPEITKKELESVKTVISGAAPAGKTLINALIKKAGGELFFQEGYGMTEATCVATIAREEFKNTKIGSIGKVLAGSQCKIMDVETGDSLPSNKPGELWIKGPHVMKGYYKNESATKDTITPDGWLKTGDVAIYDEDECFYIVDRMKELIKVKGLQVSPSELEDLLHTHPGILDVAVVGIQDDRLGEAPRAFVVKKDDNLTAEDIHKFLDGKVASHKKLAGGIIFIEQIPRALSGKILRRLLGGDYGQEKK